MRSCKLHARTYIYVASTNMEWLFPFYCYCCNAPETAFFAWYVLHFIVVCFLLLASLCDFEKNWTGSSVSSGDCVVLDGAMSPIFFTSLSCVVCVCVRKYTQILQHVCACLCRCTPSAHSSSSSSSLLSKCWSVWIVELCHAPNVMLRVIRFCVLRFLFIYFYLFFAFFSSCVDNFRWQSFLFIIITILFKVD